MRKGDLALAIVTGAATAIVLASFLAATLYFLVLGAPYLSLSFLLEPPTSDLGGGGILPAILGTVVLTLLMTVAVVPLGVTTAIWLAEYAPTRSRLATLVRTAVHNLAGVPSIVFGLFGLGFFVLFAGGALDAITGQHGSFARPCVLWSALTLALLTMPVVIVASEEAMRAVPRSMRDAALALGATRLQVVVHVVLPHARRGIVTGVVLAIGRAAGEVAPLLFVGVANYATSGPTDVRDMFMHLGYHVYVLATQAPEVEGATSTAYGAIAVLLALAFAMQLVAVAFRGTRRRDA